MAIKYRAVQAVNPRDLEAPRKYYARPSYDGTLSIREICRDIADSSTVSPADVFAVVESLLQKIPDYLIDNKIVKLGDFGTFRLSFSSSGAENEEDLDSGNIKKNKILFRSGNLLMNEVNNAKYTKV